MSRNVLLCPGNVRFYVRVEYPGGRREKARSWRAISYWMGIKLIS